MIAVERCNGKIRCTDSQCESIASRHLQEIIMINKMYKHDGVIVKLRLYNVKVEIQTYTHRFNVMPHG